MKIIEMKRTLSIILSLLLVTTNLGCIAEMDNGLTCDVETVQAEAGEVIDSADTTGVTADEPDLEDFCYENDEISVTAIDPDVAETEEMDLPADDSEDQEAVEPQGQDMVDSQSLEDIDPNPPVEPEQMIHVTYCFIEGDTLVACQTAVEGEEIAAPKDPAAPEGMAFAGWALEDGTPVFIDGAPLIAHADPQIPGINVLAVYWRAAQACRFGRSRPPSACRANRPGSPSATSACSARRMRTARG